jgi:hypothetical protein
LRIACDFGHSAKADFSGKLFPTVREMTMPIEKRGLFFERVVAHLQLHTGFTDIDLDDALHAALTGLIQTAVPALRR